MTFANGYTVSVQFGAFHYCSARDLNVPYDAWKQGSDTHMCDTAEVAIMHPDGSFVRFDKSDDDVRGHTDPDTVAKIIAWVAAQDKP
jgi:hypothetical protein